MLQRKFFLGVCRYMCKVILQDMWCAFHILSLQNNLINLDLTLCVNCSRFIRRMDSAFRIYIVVFKLQELIRCTYFISGIVKNLFSVILKIIFLRRKYTNLSGSDLSSLFSHFAKNVNFIWLLSSLVLIFPEIPLNCLTFF